MRCRTENIRCTYALRLSAVCLWNGDLYEQIRGECEEEGIPSYCRTMRSRLSVIFLLNIEIIMYYLFCFFGEEAVGVRVGILPANMSRVRLVWSVHLIPPHWIHHPTDYK